MNKIDKRVITILTIIITVSLLVIGLTSCNIMSSINFIEVKEVDLEKEYKDFVEEDPVYNKLVNGIVGKAIAKHFFELGLKAQNDNIRHSMNETPKYPCDILFVTDVDNVFLFKYMENGRPIDRETPYFHNIQNGKCWYYCNDIIKIH